MGGFFPQFEQGKYRHKHAGEALQHRKLLSTALTGFLVPTVSPPPRNTRPAGAGARSWPRLAPSRARPGAAAAAAPSNSSAAPRRTSPNPKNSCSRRRWTSGKVLVERGRLGTARVWGARGLFGDTKVPPSAGRAGGGARGGPAEAPRPGRLHLGRAPGSGEIPAPLFWGETPCSGVKPPVLG